MLCFSQASVDHERQLLECKKADAKRQQDMFQRIVRVKNVINIFHEEVIVFEIKQDAQIEKNAKNETDTIPQVPVCGIFTNQRQQKAERIV